MFKKIVVSVIVLLGLAVAGFAGFVVLARPLMRPAPVMDAAPTPKRLARGEYLAHGCLDCHSKRDFKRYAGPVVPPLGAHGYCFDRGVAVPGVVCPPNITPDRETGIGAWTDGEIIRAMREGVSRDGRPLFPAMPYEDLAKMSDEDALSIVAYLRTLPAASYKAPPPKLDFPLPIVIRFLPKPLSGAVAAPPPTDRMAYGRYLTTTMGCSACHNGADAQMTPIPGREWAGGNEFRGPWGTVRSANLSPHSTGLSDKTKENFIGLFRAFGSVEGELQEGSPNTVMPWPAYNKLTDDDLGIIYDYIRAQAPVENVVEKFPKPPKA